jgi:BirA family biotin operon repressor/biotin-[acetyl-CoA-carboxylase] ligase
MPPLATGASIAIAATLAVRDTVVHLTGPECAIKWPNDVHVHGRKIAGVLVEARLDTAGNGVAIVGIGLNVNLEPYNFPAIAEAATSLALEAGHAISVDLTEATLFAKLDAAISQIAEDPQATLAAWRAALDTLGRQVTVQTRSGLLAGIAEDVDEGGNLLLRTPDAILHTLAEGDVSLGG